MAKLKSLTYEVFGTVQGVFFRKYTVNKAVELNLVGWVKNTEKGTVQGIAQGEDTEIEVFKKWLQYEGSPFSKILKVEFEEADIKAAEFKEYSTDWKPKNP
ncbi:4843_t:CDS:2 [Ambispora gerdemannii]|uniref:Acylphosphatase n=1 Tax=Ambispora gerdemannii TaxID=144530 RepID=A0A9N9FXZ3_9GLOM|nr:4843_t:CDS:2 [Ambispora gerdemannii]